MAGQHVCRVLEPAPVLSTSPSPKVPAGPHLKGVMPSTGSCVLPHHLFSFGSWHHYLCPMLSGSEHAHRGSQGQQGQLCPRPRPACSLAISPAGSLNLSVSMTITNKNQLDLLTLRGAHVSTHFSPLSTPPGFQPCPGFPSVGRWVWVQGL